MHTRRWKFLIGTNDSPPVFIGADGNPDDVSEWIGTTAEARFEGERRANLMEQLTGVPPTIINEESQGHVTEITTETAVGN